MGTRDLEEFEVVNGGLWRFGPFLLSDKEALFEAVATLSSTRIMKNKEGTGYDSDGLSSLSSDPPPVYETEMASDEGTGGAFHMDNEDQTRVESGVFRHSWLSAMEQGAA